MLGKLLKYEMKATARWFVPLYGMLLVLAVLNKLMFAIDIERLMNLDTLSAQFAAIPKVVTMAIYVFVIVGVFVLTAVMIIQRFYRNLLGDEGYLMFTLPVKPWMNIVNKLAAATIWILASSVVTMLSVFILAFDRTMIEDLAGFFPDILWEFKDMFGVSLVSLMVLCFLALFVGLLVSVLQVYVSIAIGQLLNNHKILGSIGAYIGINIVMQTLSSVFMVLSSLLTDWQRFNIHPGEYIMVTLLGATVLNLVLGAAFYFVTQYLLTKKLNLE